MDDRYGSLITAALRGDPVQVPDRLNPGHLLWKISEHGLAGLLAEAQARDGGRVLPELAASVKALAAAQEASVRHHLAAALELARALREAGVPAVFVKGAAFAVTVYPRPGLRTFGDLDLLVPPASLPAARAVLASLRFVPDSDEPPSRMEATYSRDDNDSLPVEVDLHWAFTTDDQLQAAVQVPVDEILQRRREAGGLPIPTTEDSLLLAAANLVRSRVDRMVLIVDFARLAAAAPDWDAVVSRAAAWRLRTALWLGLSLAQRLFGAAPPERAMAALAPSHWRRRWIAGLLSGSALWARRKVRHRVVAYGLPLLCADSWDDLATDLGGSRSRLLARLGLRRD